MIQNWFMSLILNMAQLQLSYGIMEKIFAGFDTNRVDEACKLLAKSTPAIAATLLQRNDISEKYNKGN